MILLVGRLKGVGGGGVVVFWELPLLCLTLINLPSNLAAGFSERYRDTWMQVIEGHVIPTGATCVCLVYDSDKLAWVCRRTSLFPSSKAHSMFCINSFSNGSVRQGCPVVSKKILLINTWAHFNCILFLCLKTSSTASFEDTPMNAQ